MAGLRSFDDLLANSPLQLYTHECDAHQDEDNWKLDVVSIWCPLFVRDKVKLLEFRVAPDFEAEYGYIRRGYKVARSLHFFPPFPVQGDGHGNNRSMRELAVKQLAFGEGKAARLFEILHEKYELIMDAHVPTARVIVCFAVEPDVYEARWTPIVDDLWTEDDIQETGADKFQTDQTKEVLLEAFRMLRSEA